MTDTLLSSRLRAETRDWHDRMETLMQRADVFASRLNYGRFTTAQYPVSYTHLTLPTIYSV